MSIRFEEIFIKIFGIKINYILVQIVKTDDEIEEIVQNGHLIMFPEVYTDKIVVLNNQFIRFRSSSKTNKLNKA